MKRLTLVLLVVFVLMLTACSGGSGNTATKTTEPEMGDTTETEVQVEEGMSGEETDSGEIDIVAIMEGNVFLAMDRNLYFEYEVYGEGETANMSAYITPTMMRVDTAPGSSDNIVGIYDVETDYTFFYIPSEGYGATMSEVELFAEFDYQMEMMEYADDIVNVEETTLNGWDVIYGQAEVDGGQIEFWYSQEYAMMMKYVVVTPEGEEMYFLMTYIEMPESIDSSVFEKPDDIKFFDLDESSSESLVDQFFSE